MILRIVKITIFIGILIVQATSQSWQNGVPLNLPRAGAAATIWDGKIYVFGGKSINNKILNSVEVFDPATGQWDTTAVPSFIQSRYNASICVWENKFYLTGGRTLDGALKSMEVYDPVQNIWYEAQDLRREREGHSANYFNDRVYVIGGQSDSDKLIEEIEWYDYTDEKWKDAVFDLPYPRSAHFAAIVNDDYYMFGGYYYGLTNTIYRANKTAEGYSWEQIGTLSDKRAYGVTAVIDSLIYLIGGETESGKTNMVEIFNINNGMLKMGLEMNMSHSGMTVAVLDKRIYSIGGYEAFSNEPINHVHIFAPEITSLNDITINQPSTAILAKAYPNPFNGQVNIDLDIGHNNNISLNIFSITGQHIYSTKMQVNKETTFRWNARNFNDKTVPSGIYFAIIKSGNQQKVIKLTYVK